MRRREDASSNSSSSDEDSSGKSGNSSSDEDESEEDDLQALEGNPRALKARLDAEVSVYCSHVHPCNLVATSLAPRLPLDTIHWANQIYSIL